MSKLKHNNIKSGLTKKGFKISDSYHDHVILTLYYNDSPTGIWTKLSHGGGKEIGEGLIHTMASQLKLNKKQFKDLVDCIMSRDSYIAELQKQNITI